MKISWGHGVVIALGCFMLFILGMIFLFPINKQNAEMITEDYYEEELHYQKVIDAKRNADSLENKPTIDLITDKGIVINFPKEFTNTDTKFNFYLYHQADKNLDIKKDFTLDNNNQMTIPNVLLKKGHYVLKINWFHNNTEYQRDFEIVWK